MEYKHTHKNIIYIKITKIMKDVWVASADERRTEDVVRPRDGRWRRLAYVLGLLPLRSLLSGERRSAWSADVRFEPKVAGHVIVGFRQQGQQLLFGLSELFERHSQPGFQADRVRVIVVLVVHDSLGQFALDVLVLEIFQFLGG